MKTLVVVVGIPRSGTSLACDLVRICGYNLGAVAMTRDVRRGRNHHPVHSNARYTSFDGIRKWVADLDEEGITAIKLIPEFETMLPIINKVVEDLRVVVTTREVREAVVSHIEYALLTDPLNNYREVKGLRDKIVKAADGVLDRDEAILRLLEDPDIKTHNLDFMMVQNHDVRTFSALKRFLSSDVDETEMMHAVIPSVSKYSMVNYDHLKRGY